MDLTKHVLSTPRLRLRPWRRVDLDAMADWPLFTAPLDQDWNWPRRMRAERSLDFFYQSHASDPSRAAWTILRHDAVVGLLQLKQIRRSEGDPELGIAFGFPWIGQGYGRETLTAFLNFFFGPAGFKGIRLEVAPANLRAHRLYLRLGFEELSRFWRHVGVADAYAFLDRPDYVALRPFFRHTGTGVYQMYVEMRLDATTWHADRAAGDPQAR